MVSVDVKEIVNKLFEIVCVDMIKTTLTFYGRMISSNVSRGAIIFRKRRRDTM